MLDVTNRELHITAPGTYVPHARRLFDSFSHIGKGTNPQRNRVTHFSANDRLAKLHNALTFGQSHDKTRYRTAPSKLGKPMMQDPLQRSQRFLRPSLAKAAQNCSDRRFFASRSMLAHREPHPNPHPSRSVTAECVSGAGVAPAAPHARPSPSSSLPMIQAAASSSPFFTPSSSHLLRPTKRMQRTRARAHTNQKTNQPNIECL